MSQVAFAVVTLPEPMVMGKRQPWQKYLRTLSAATYTAGIILYRDYLYGNLYQMPIHYVEIGI